MLLLGNTRTRLVSLVFDDGSWALIQEAASAASLRTAGIPSADLDDTSWGRCCPSARRRHTL